MGNPRQSNVLFSVETQVKMRHEHSRVKQKIKNGISSRGNASGNQGNEKKEQKQKNQNYFDF